MNAWWLAGLTAVWVAVQLSLAGWVLALLERSAATVVHEDHHGTRDPRIDDAAMASALLLILAPLVIAGVAARGKRPRAAVTYGVLSAILLIPAVDTLAVFNVLFRWTSGQ